MLELFYLFIYLFSYLFIFLASFVAMGTARGLHIFHSDGDWQLYTALRSHKEAFSPPSTALIQPSCALSLMRLPFLQDSEINGDSLS